MKITCPKCKRRIRVKRQRIMRTCKCGYQFTYEECFGNLDKIYLVDANICIYSINNDRYRGSHCSEVISRNNIATTDIVFKEIRGPVPKSVKIYQTGRISNDIREIHTSRLTKQPSIQDLSLIQVAIKRPEIAGIITYDRDFKDIAAVGLVLLQSEKGANFWIGNAHEFLRKHKDG